MKGVAYLPFPVLYALSDLFYVIVFHLVGYRRKVVAENLRKSFPEKSEAERSEIARKYYHHFCDLFLETAKMYRLTPDKMDKHMRFEHLDRMHPAFNAGKGIVLLCFHYNNWEWNSYMNEYTKHRLWMVYSPMKSNPSMDAFVTKCRTQYGGMEVPMQGAPRAAMSLHKGPDLGLMWLAADQTPPAASQYWTTFLNQETPFFSGPQKIGKKTNAPVYFHYIHKVKRGQYVAYFFEITPDPSKDGEHDILLDYVDIVEQIIRRKPEFWLWSHRRWKHHRQEDQELIARNPQSRFTKQIDDMLDRLDQIQSW